MWKRSTVGRFYFYSDEKFYVAFDCSIGKQSRFSDSEGFNLSLYWFWCKTYHLQQRNIFSNRIYCTILGTEEAFSQVLVAACENKVDSLDKHVSISRCTNFNRKHSTLGCSISYILHSFNFSPAAAFMQLLVAACGNKVDFQNQQASNS